MGEEAFCEAHIEQVVSIGKLASKMTVIIVLLTANAALLMAIFGTLLANNTAYAALESNMASLQTDVRSLQTLTKDHAGIVATQNEVLRRLNILEASKMR